MTQTGNQNQNTNMSIDEIVKNILEEKEAKLTATARRIAVLYLEQYPRKEKYAVTLYSSEWSDNNETVYYPISDDERKIIESYDNRSDDDEGLSLEDYLSQEDYEILLESFRPSEFGELALRVDRISSIDLKHPLKFCNFSIKILSKDGQLQSPKRVGVELNDSEFIDLLAEVLKSKNELSFNQLIYRKPELSQKITKHLVNAGADYQFEMTDPFICEMTELTDIAKSILDPFIDRAHLFDRITDSEVQQFAFTHQLVPEDGFIYKEINETYQFGCEMHFHGTDIIFEQQAQTGIDLNLSDEDQYTHSALDAMRKFGLEKLDDILPYLQKNYNNKNALSEIREFLTKKSK